MEREGGICFTDCMGRIPYGSLIATFILGTGVAVACICLWIGLPRMIEMMELFNVDITRMTNDFRNYVIIVGVVMAGIAVVELILGFMATGNTRRQVYTGFKSRFLGRVGTAFFILVTYLLTLVWCLLCFILVILAFFFIISQTHCEKHGDGTHWDSADCFNATVLLDGFPIDLPVTEGQSSYNTRVCGLDFQKYCNQSQDGSIYIYAATAGVGLVILGLVHYLMCLTANYAMIKDGAKLREFEDIKFAEEVELRNIMEGNTTSHHPNNSRMDSSYYQ